jgi:uncharacterized membrane protein YhaH (DUF805 family)
VDDARRRWLPDDEASVASRAAAVQLLRTWSPFRFQGRLGRGAYALALVAWHAACAIGTGVAFTVVLLVARIVGGPEALNAVVLPTILVVALAYVVGLVGYAVRRLHDLSRSGAWAAIGFVPFVGFVSSPTCCSRRARRARTRSATPRRARSPSRWGRRRRPWPRGRPP